MRRRASPAGRRRSDTRYRLACTPPNERCRPAPGRESRRVVRFARWPVTAAKRCRPQATSTKTCSTSPGVALTDNKFSIDCIGDSRPVPESHPVCARWAVAAASRGYLALSPPCPCCSTGTRARGGGSAVGRYHLGGHRPPTRNDAPRGWKRFHRFIPHDHRIRDVAPYHVSSNDQNGTRTEGKE